MDIKQKTFVPLAVALLIATAAFVIPAVHAEVVADSGVRKIEGKTLNIPIGPDGMTVEQRNIARRLVEDNTPGAQKFLYVQSAFSGKLLFASNIDGKVTSSGKRLNPYSVESAGESEDGFLLRIGEWTGYTTEVLEDDGTYGDSIPYLFWWDVNGISYQLYPTGGQIIHITSQPLKTRDVVIDMRITKENSTQ